MNVIFSTMNKAFLILAVITVSCTAQVDYFSVRGLLGPSDKNAINQWVSTYRNDKSIVSNSITQASQAAANTKNEIFGKYSSKVQQAFTETQDIGQKALSGQNDANSVESQLTRTYSRLSNNDRRSFNELFSRVYGYDLGSIINTGMSSNGRGRRPGVVGFLPLLLGAVFINFGLLLFIGGISGAPTPQTQNPGNGMNVASSGDVYVDPYVILGAIPEMVDSQNKHITLNTVLAQIPSRTPIDQVIRLTEWYSRSFSYYKQPITPWINSVIAASEKAKIDSTNAINSLSSSRLLATSQYFVQVGTTYSQFLVATEQVMAERMSPQEYIQGIRQLFNKLVFEEKQIFDKTFQDIYGYSFVNILRESF
ncbi:hypothetical protein FO519_009191 [Halicephalobus sp. NKZ332]|nr:hypothetical protein FO519_009191 [Halicephalobus sp. NKZ332]